MATLNLSTNGPSISKSYQSVVNSPPPSGSAAASPTYGQWSVFSVSAPLVNAFQQNASGKESVLKVQSTGEGELADLIDEFSDGKVMFAFVKVKDPNTSLPKYVLIGWCGEGVPERTKGYFTSYSNAVVKVLHGYHVQVTARSDRDLTPEGIVQKVADASGSKYSAGSTPAASSGPPPPAASKPVFTPTRSTGGARGFNPLAATGISSTGPRSQNVDKDGWGQDAPPVTRSQLEKVQSAYQPTKVNMAELTSQKPNQSRFAGASQEIPSDRPDVVRGAYQPVGKVDIAAIRAQAQSKDNDRPTIVKGAYEPVGKVDIAAIRAKAQGPSQEMSSPPSNMSPAATGTSTLTDRSAPFTSSERLTTLPKPKVANKFGSSASTFGGTKPPAPGGFGFEGKSAAPAPPVGVGRTFANEAGKSPAQIWAEKKAKERGDTGIAAQPSMGAAPVSPLMNQTSGGQGWKSGYTGKSWASVGTTKTGGSASGVNQQHTGDSQEPDREEPQQTPSGGISSLRNKFANAPPMGAGMPASNERSAPSPPPLDTSNKPNASRGVPMPGLPQRSSYNEESAQHMPVPPPAQPPRSPTPPTPQDSGSPIRVAMPVARGAEPEVENAREEQMSPPPAMPMHSLSNAIPQQREQEEEEDDHVAARAAGAAVAASTFGHEAAEQAQPGAEHSGKTAIAQFDYEKAEDNELELREGEHVSNIEMVDDDWWMGQNSRGETGLFPSNYVELVEGGAAAAAPAGQAAAQQEEEPTHQHISAAAEPEHHGGAGETGATATAVYDYEAAEDNELSFPEGATITGVEFPDEDWWSGEYRGKAGLFPANYVKLDE